MYSGVCDGYLGYDFFEKYKTVIDLNKMCLQIHIDKILENEQTKENNDKYHRKLFFHFQTFLTHSMSRLLQVNTPSVAY